MSDPELIEEIAKALAVDRGGAANATDKDFATKFVRAYKTLMAVQRAER